MKTDMALQGTDRGDATRTQAQSHPRNDTAHRPGSWRRRIGARPYTVFLRGGRNRFGRVSPEFRPFRIT